MLILGSCSSFQCLHWGFISSLGNKMRCVQTLPYKLVLVEIRMSGLSRCGDKWACETHSRMLPGFTGFCVEILSFIFHCFLGKDLSRLKTQFQPFVRLPEDKQRALYKTLCELLIHEEMVAALGDVVRWRTFGFLPKSNFRIVLAFPFAWIFLFSRSFAYSFAFSLMISTQETSQIWRS